MKELFTKSELEELFGNKRPPEQKAPIGAKTDSETASRIESDPNKMSFVRALRGEATVDDFENLTRMGIKYKE